MDTTARIWIEFAAGVAVIGVAGTHLTRYGDALAALTGLSRSWIGIVLLATVTSLPELVTGLSAVTLAGSPDLAAGDALGSCTFNLLIVALADIGWRRQPFFAQASTVHVRAAAWGIALLALAAAGIVLPRLGLGWQLGHVDGISLLLVAGYAAAMRALFRAEPGDGAAAAPGPPPMGLRRALAGYGVAALVIVAAGIWLPLVGVQLARAMGWTDGFVGTLFVGLATSVPELATTVAALRLGAVDLALGNLLGSNLFDLLIVALDDVAWVEGSLFRRVAGVHAVSALTALLMSGVVVLALVRRPRRRWFGLGSWAALALVALYAANVAVHAWHGA